MHHGQTRGETKTRKLCKNNVHFTKSESKFQKVRGK